MATTTDTDTDNEGWWRVCAPETRLDNGIVILAYRAAGRG